MGKSKDEILVDNIKERFNVFCNNQSNCHSCNYDYASCDTECMIEWISDLIRNN